MHGMSGESFSTTLSAEIRVPQSGFTLDELKQHMRTSRIPLDASLRPAIVRNVPDPEHPNITTDEEFRLVAEWGD